MASVRVPPTVFGIPFGLAGLAGSWGVAAGKGNAPTWVGDALLALAAVVWLAATAGYVAYTAHGASPMVEPWPSSRTSTRV
ncbi:hypothetical protein [Micromonospora sp. BL4]|uniref:hypothetical protein n=1 Tax=Micromonospora sp. BL4 TaxID=2478710 RepID=UPI00131519D1|nr:hypothetical protein [Micromonospora sp. BL4]